MSSLRLALKLSMEAEKEPDPVLPPKQPVVQKRKRSDSKASIAGSEVGDGSSSSSSTAKKIKETKDSASKDKEIKKKTAAKEALAPEKKAGEAKVKTEGSIGLKRVKRSVRRKL